MTYIDDGGRECCSHCDETTENCGCPAVAATVRSPRVCSCGREFKSLAGLNAHRRACPVARAEVAAFDAATERGATIGDAQDEAKRAGIAFLQAADIAVQR